MGSLNPFSKPKTPKPVVTPAPVAPNADPEAKLELEAERRRRATATGSSGNIKSSLINAVTDLESTSKKSSLLGG